MEEVTLSMLILFSKPQTGGILLQGKPIHLVLVIMMAWY